MEILLYNGKVKIDFTERDWGGNKIHIYKDAKGNKLVSVTGITKTIDKSNFLIPWAIKLMGKYLTINFIGKTLTDDGVLMATKEWRKVKEEAADIGSDIHDWIEQKIKGLDPAIPDDDKVKNGVLAFLKWTNENKIKWLETERLVYSKKHNFVGTLDAIAKIKGKTYLIDYKSGKGIYSEAYLQTAGYQLAYEEETGKKLDGRILLHLGKEDGTFEHRGINDYEKDKKAFLGLWATKKRLIELETNSKLQ